MRYMTLGLKTVLLLAVCMYAQAAFAQTENQIQYDYTGIYLAHDIDHHFTEARMDFFEGKFQASAYEIGRAVSYMKLEEDRSSGKAAEALDDSIEELESLEGKVEDGKVDSEQTLAMAFARAHRALAEHHYIKAEEAVGKKDVKGTAGALKATSLHLKLALAWAGNKGEEVVSDALDAVTAVIDKLEKTGEWAGEEVGKVIEILGKAIEDFAKALEPPKKQ